MTRPLDRLEADSARAAELLRTLERRGARLRVDDDRLKVSAPKEVLDEAMATKVQELKQDLITLLRAREEVPILARDEPLSLGIVQQRMWMMDRLEPETTVNNLPGAWRLIGKLDREVFERALRTVVDRHEVLRSRIVFDGVAPGQLADPGWVFHLPVTDLSDQEREIATRRMMQEIVTSRDEPFDLGRTPLFRCRLFVFGPTDHVFFLLPHHVIWDGWSWDVFLDELATSYEALVEGKEPRLAPLPFQFADYASWHRRLMDGPEYERQMEYWRQILEGGIPPLALRTDRPRPTVRSRRGQRRKITLDEKLLSGLREIGRDEQATLFMVLLATYFAWLHRRSGQTDFAVGVPTQDRLHEAAHKLIGPLVNTLVIRVQLEPSHTFRQLLSVVRDRCIGAYDHQDVPIDRLVEELGPDPRDEKHDPLFQSLFAYQDVQNRPSSFGSLELQQVHIDTGVCPSDLLFGFMIGKDQGVGLLDFDVDLFDPSTIDRMSESLLALMRDVAQNPDRRLAELILFDPRERAEMDAGDELFVTDAGTSIQRPSAGQEATWFIEKMTRQGDANHLIEVLELDAEVDHPLLEEALGHVLSRHDALRTTILEDRGRPRPSLAEVVDARVVEVTLATADLDGWIEGFGLEPFDPRTAPYLRTALISAGDHGSLLCVVVHALVVDDFSIHVFLEQWAETYSALSSGKPPPDLGGAPYQSYVEAERCWIRSDEARASVEWWSRRLTEQYVPLELPGEPSDSPELSLRGSSVSRDIDAGIAHAWHQLASRARVDANVPMIAAVNLLLRKLTGTSRVSVGVGIRVPPGDSPKWRGTVGPMRNTIVHRSSVERSARVLDEVGKIGRRWSEELAHGRYPFSGLVEQLQPNRAEGWHPFFQVSVVPGVRAARATFGEAVARSYPARQVGTIEDLSFTQLELSDGSLRVRLDYREGRFDRASAESIVEQLATIITRMSKEPEAPVADLFRPSSDEQSELIRLGSGDTLPIQAESVVHLVEAVASEEPDRVAVVDRHRSLTYGDLWDRSARVASGLAARGTTPGSIVGACFERSVSMLTGLLGIWRAGCAYLPLDPEFPGERLAFMVRDAGCEIIVTDGRARPPETDADVVQAEELVDVGESNANLPLPDAEDPAYVLYTSGSTGRPKGVVVRHQNLSNFTTSMVRKPGLASTDVLLAITTTSFDIAGLELWSPLVVGARLEIADDMETRDGSLLAERLTEAGVTVMQGTPATWRMLLEDGWEGRLSKILCGGEAFPKDLLDPLLQRADEVWNMYGPTETTIWSTISLLQQQAGGSVPIGRPIENTQVYVLDPDGELVPRGLSGELWIGGAGVAAGYLGREKLTSERFVNDPFRGEGRMYRTGDLVRWRADGQLEHLGRIDDQVKIQGHRVELGELEAVLARHPAVSAAVAVIHGQAQHARLSAYFVQGGHKRVTGSELRRFARTFLPYYMVPGVIAELDELPLTPNGKIDRRALPTPTRTEKRREFVRPSTQEEIRIAEVWMRLLEVDNVSKHDNFFELGGHSLLAIRAVAELQRDGLHVDARTFFFNSLAQVAESATVG